jgi:23S rRNA (uracil1939-C5)-methyltransferase
MPVARDSLLILDVEKAAAGGRMLARHQGHVVLVSGAIPGERVRARVERVGKGVLFAQTVDVVSASPDRRTSAGDPRCGGNAFTHVSYPRQLQLKGEIIRDAFARIARMPLTHAPAVMASPEHGYRMRARLHAHQSRLGFFLEGTHDLCDAAATGQLLDATTRWIETAQEVLRSKGLTGLAALDIAENCQADERACHLELHRGVEAPPFEALLTGLTGLSAASPDQPGGITLGGATVVSDVLNPLGSTGPALRLRRNVRAFFQSNRFLLEPLVAHVLSFVPAGPVLDLYAGVGLFGLSLAAAGAEDVTLVEGDPTSSSDLRDNAVPYEERVRVERRSVESFLMANGVGQGTTRQRGRQGRPPDDGLTVIVDPPRTGLSTDALNGVLALRPARLVYVSCDVATLARDSRAVCNAGYELQHLSGMDLFPSTAHVETVAVFDVG